MLLSDSSPLLISDVLHFSKKKRTHFLYVLAKTTSDPFSVASSQLRRIGPSLNPPIFDEIAIQPFENDVNCRSFVEFTDKVNHLDKQPLSQG